MDTKINQLLSGMGLHGLDVDKLLANNSKEMEVVQKQQETVAMVEKM